MAKKITKLNQTAEEITSLLDSLAENYSSDRTTIEKIEAGYDANMELLQSTSTQVPSLSNDVGRQDLKIEEHTNDIKTLQDSSATYNLTYLDNKLSLVKTDISGASESVSEIKIVSASDVENSVITTSRITPQTITVSKNNPGIIEYTVISEDKSGPTGDITVTWRIDGVKQAVTERRNK